MLPKEELLKGIENRETITRIIDLAEQAIKTWEIILSNFLSPPEIFEAEGVFQKLTEVEIVSWGGYSQAERKRLAIARSDLPIDTSNVALKTINIEGNFLFDTATHRDFLGSMLGTGIELSLIHI